MRRKTASKTGWAAPAGKGRSSGAEKQEPAAGAVGGSFPIVGIGASAGGSEALRELFSNLPEDTGMGFVVVMHQQPEHSSLLADLLREVAPIPVTEAVDGVVVEPDHVYVAPPGGLLSIASRTLHRLGHASGEAKPLPIDFFLRYLAQDQRDRAVCVILSGSGTDGTLGLKAIKAENGMAMVQEARSALYAGMPSSAVATKLVDYVLPPAAMGKQLLIYARGPYLQSVAEQRVMPQEPVQRILLLLRSRSGHDFSGYKPSTIRRRIERRLNVHGIADPDQYLSFLQETPHEIDVLFKELLVSVTSFFRDPDAFETLAAGPLPDLLKSRPEGSPFRVWVPGCATGEEAYSMAILLREVIGRLERNLEVQIFGTDLDAGAIEAARAGRYSEGIAGDVSPERLERFFRRDETGAMHIRKDIREMCVFAPHNVVKDAPFTRMDLVSCRNLLIYLDAPLQKRLLGVFHYALKPGGLLFLGPSESVGTSTLFEPLSGKWKIFRRCETDASNRVLPDLPLSAPLAEARERDQAEGQASPAPMPSTFTTQIERLLLNWYCPAAVVVNERGDIIHIQGRTGAYLEPAEGRPRMNVLEMAREGLKRELNYALRQAAREPSGEVVRENVSVKSNGETIHVNLSVARIAQPEAIRGLLVLTFQTAPPPPVESERKQLSPAESDEVRQLERELQLTRESLQTTIVDLENSNEALKNANEALKSTNEELQSSNEELETSREEMQSLNEELTTVNAEMQDKVEALASAHDDMQNLLDSTDIATIFLDNDLLIKRYTEQARNLVKLIPTDVGRPIGDLVSNLDYEELEGDCRRVFRSLKPREIEVCTKDEHWYLMRIVPYRTAENVIDGLVITFVDISEVHHAARRAQGYLDAILLTMHEPFVALDAAHRIRCCNQAFASLFAPEPVEGQPFFEIGSGIWNVPALQTLLNEQLPRLHRVERLRVETLFPGEKSSRFLFCNAHLVECVDGGANFLLAFTDCR